MTQIAKKLAQMYRDELDKLQSSNMFYGEVTPEVLDFCATYEKVQNSAREKLAEIEKCLDEHDAVMRKGGEVNYGYVGDIDTVDNLLADVLVCLTGEGE